MNCTLTCGPSDWDAPVLARPLSVGVTSPRRMQNFGDAALLIIRYMYFMVLKAVIIVSTKWLRPGGFCDKQITFECSSCCTCMPRIYNTDSA